MDKKSKKKTIHNVKDVLRVQGRVVLGPILMVIANIYGTVLKVLIEIVQNQIDSRATNALHIINLQKGTWSAWDNGEGASILEMENKFQTIGLTSKGPEDSGEKGLGYFAGLAIARFNTFFSRLRSSKDRNKHPFYRVSIDREEIKTKRDVDFDIEMLDPSFNLGNGWSTSVTLKEIDKAALRSFSRPENSLQGLCDAVASAFRDKIRSTGIQVEICIVDKDGMTSTRIVRPLEYTGQREIVEINTALGPVKFEMFLTESVQKNPSLMVGYGGKASLHIRGLEDIWGIISDVLGSGHFQGNIRVNFCTVAPDREHLVTDKAYDVFVEAVMKFVTDYATPWLRKLEQIRRADQIEDVVLEALDKVSKFLDVSGLELDERFRAAVSKGHKDALNMPVDGKIRTKPRKKRKPRQIGLPHLDQDKDKPPFPPKREKLKRKRKGREKDMTHPGVESPEGTVRRIIQGQRGLQVVYVSAEGERWRVRVGTSKDGENEGRILLNTSHRETATYLDNTNTKAGSRRCNNYLAHLFIMLVAMGSIVTSERATTFKEEFEDTFMAFVDAFVS